MRHTDTYPFGDGLSSQMLRTTQIVDSDCESRDALKFAMIWHMRCSRIAVPATSVDCAALAKGAFWQEISYRRFVG
jgi:hypothetical protein